MDNLAIQIATNMAFAVPLFIVYAFGALLALSRWQQHPRTSLFVLGGTRGAAYRLARVEHRHAERLLLCERAECQP